MRVLVLTTPYPSSCDPEFGIFIEKRTLAIAAHPAVRSLEVLAPVPYFPKLPFRVARRWQRWSEFPRQETRHGIRIDRPQYPLIPRYSAGRHARTLERVLRRHVARQRVTYDLIDAQYTYPHAVAAARADLAPVITTGRGEDMCRFPDHPVIGPQIQEHLTQMSHAIALSPEIQERFVSCGVSSDRVTWIANGVDPPSGEATLRLSAQQKQALRQSLGLPATGTIVLSVGDRYAVKGFPLLTEAFALAHLENPHLHLVIVGGPPRSGIDDLEAIAAVIQRYDIANRVTLAGHQPHARLAEYYQAADLFLLTSQREGCPNVVMEALSHGLPVLSTDVGDVRLRLDAVGLECGRIVKRDSQAISQAILGACETSWDPQAIAASHSTRTWDDVAAEVVQIYRSVLES